MIQASNAHIEQYRDEGYTIARGMFSPEEVAFYRDHFMAMRAEGPKPGDYGAHTYIGDDPLYKFPRLINMHHWDEHTMRWVLSERFKVFLTGLLGREPYASQTMLYFKPPKSRGQALHQDNWYLRASPGSCIGAWLALDDCDEANGCLQLVPGSNKWPLLCSIPADSSQSFTNNTVPLPEGAEVRSMIMRAGDVLFFHGSVVHGSMPNTTVDRFRRALIGHYVEGDVSQVWKFYSPAHRFDGSLVEIGEAPEGGLCGTWVTKDGEQVVEMAGQLGSANKSLE